MAPRCAAQRPAAPQRCSESPNGGQHDGSVNPSAVKPRLRLGVLGGLRTYLRPELILKARVYILKCFGRGLCRDPELLLLWTGLGLPPPSRPQNMRDVHATGDVQLRTVCIINDDQ